MMEIRKMSSAHLEEIAQLEELCFIDPWSLPMLEPELKNPLSLWLVAVADEKVLGYIGSQAVLDAADIMNVAVHPNFRRKKIAEQLINELCSQLNSEGVCFVSLEVRVSNIPAINLYEKLGFLQVGLRPNYYRKPREDAIIMRKELS